MDRETCNDLKNYKGASSNEATSFIRAVEEGGAGCEGGASIGLGEGQVLISSPVKKKKNSASEMAYLNDGTFDEDQELTLQITDRDGHSIREYVTPDNSPEQMFELANAVELGIPENKIKIMANPTISYMALQVAIKAWKQKIDLTGLLSWADPFVLNEALLAAKSGLDLDKLLKPGLNHRQIEQRRKIMEAGGDPDSISGNYNEMRAKRFPESNISNKLNPVPKGQGTKSHKRK